MMLPGPSDALGFPYALTSSAGRRPWASSKSRVSRSYTQYLAGSWYGEFMIRRSIVGRGIALWRSRCCYSTDVKGRPHLIRSATMLWPRKLI